MSYNVHDCYKQIPVEVLQTISKTSRLNYSICLMNLEYDINIGNCIRSAHILGCSRVYIFGRRRYDLRSTVGANHYIDVVKHSFNSIECTTAISIEFQKMVRDNHLYPIMIDKTANSYSIRKISEAYDYSKSIGKQVCLVFGNEQSGIPSCLLDNYPAYHINQVGVIRSLNVSSAAAVAMYEMYNTVMENEYGAATASW